MPPSKERASRKNTVEKSKKQPKLDDEEKKKRKQIQTWNTYIYKVLKEVHEDVGITRKSMIVMNNFMDDIFERIIQEASRLVKKTKKKTMARLDIQTAVCLLIPGELAKHAVSEGNKAVRKYNISVERASKH